MAKALGRKYINIILGFGIFLMIALIMLAFSQINKLNNANKLIIHSHEVIEETDKILINLNYAESRIRAYFITKDESYIADLDGILTALYKHTFNLNYLTKDNQLQQSLIANLVNDINWRIIDIKTKVSLFKSKGIDHLFKLPKTAIVVSERIRKTMAEVLTNEANILNTRGKLAESKYAIINSLILLCGFLSFSFILLGIYLLNQQIKFRERAERSLEQSENELYRLAYHDPLTGLYNRTMIHNSIDNFINSSNAENQHIAILYIDLDNFKNINDSLGPETGDALLKAFAKRLVETQSRDTLTARLGSDQFVVLLTHINHKDEIWNIAKNISQLMSAPFKVKSHKILLTSSIGISTYPGNGKNSHELIKNADLAMCKAKELGKNNIQFSMQELTKHAEERAMIDYELHRALENNEFYLVYQPIISLKDNSVVSVEVLIRWQRPNVGIVYPDHFIKLAENNGLIMPIGDWILQRACIESKKWNKIRSNGNPIKIAVNVSTRQFILSDFASRVKKVLKQTDYDPNLLDIEITESVLFENSYSNLATLNALKEMGIKISIDDFGTGYSSLNYLRTFAIDKLKIDKSFIDEADPDIYTSRIITSIINMAHDLDLTVLAEGIETSKQLEFLKKHHCDEAQGYHLSYPLTADELLVFLQSHSTNSTF